MSPTVPVLGKAHLAGPDNRQLLATGVFYLRGAVCRVTFASVHGMKRFLDFYLDEADDTMAVLLDLTRQGEEFPSANLRFQINRRHQVAAAVLIATDKHGRNHSWMTQGQAGRDDVALAHDSWNPGETAFPPDSFITIAELLALLPQWVFDDVLPPSAVRWIAGPDIGWS
jgi:hypothetical protein